MSDDEESIPHSECVPDAALHDIIKTRGAQMYRSEYVRMAREILMRREGSTIEADPMLMPSRAILYDKESGPDDVAHTVGKEHDVAVVGFTLEEKLLVSKCGKSAHCYRLTREIRK